MHSKNALADLNKNNKKIESFDGLSTSQIKLMTGAISVCDT